MPDVTTFCSLWKLEFAIRPTLFLTDHDDIISHDGDTYLPQHAADGTLTDSRTGLSVDSGGIAHIADPAKHFRARTFETEFWTARSSRNFGMIGEMMRNRINFERPHRRSQFFRR